jgi:L-alanine-DL-glutamate epimerase-like enolase superfamily enzyme
MHIIDSIDYFYLSLPEILDISDGSQDALLVRVISGEFTGWGECEASPLVTIASMISPMSHSTCKPVAVSALGEAIESPKDIYRIHEKIRRNSADLLQADHALSGIDIALWDLLGKIRQEPIYKLLGFNQAYPKVPYYSLLFDTTPEGTFKKARQAVNDGFKAVKFGWGTFGRKTLQSDIDHIVAAREGLGEDPILCVDAGMIWGSDVNNAVKRLPTLEKFNVTWLEEPFFALALDEYRELSKRSKKVKLAGGEAAHNEYIAKLMIDYAGIDYIQIDPGRIGGITSAKRVFDYVDKSNKIFVNHTFTSHLALSAALQTFAGGKRHFLCEYPGQISQLGKDLTTTHLSPNKDGEITLPEGPGLGLNPNLEKLQKYLLNVHINVNGECLYLTPPLTQ